MSIFNKLFGTKGNRSVDTISADSIKNVWAVVDGKTIEFLKTKSREEQFAFGISVAKEIADEVYPSIQKWMDKNRCMVSIMMLNPFVSPWADTTGNYPAFNLYETAPISFTIL